MMKRIYVSTGRSQNNRGFLYEASWRVDRQRTRDDDISAFLKSLGEYASAEDGTQASDNESYDNSDSIQEIEMNNEDESNSSIGDPMS